LEPSQAEAIVSIGVDLAWSARNPTGLAAIRWDVRNNAQAAELLALGPDEPALTDDAIIAYIRQVMQDDGRQSVLVAVDAPLSVPNETGRRPGEAQFGAVFARFHAGAHPANRKRLGGYNNGEVRGEVLLRRLAEMGIRHAAVISPRQPTRQAFEVYPHPAMISLFGLERVLKYKHQVGTGHEERYAAFRAYQGYLRGLAGATPALVLPDLLLSDVHLAGRGAALKRYEDQLDAVLCAYIGLYYWWWGAEKCHVFGAFEEGYIVTPVDQRIRNLLNAKTQENSL
jgi:predicted RNase H-like nuclease